MLSVAGIDPWKWWDELRARTSSPEATSARTQSTAAVVLPEPIGTDSSLSSAPRRLILTATQRGRNASDGTVSIGIHASSPQTYRAGALLANGARIAEIYEDSIVLEHEGQSTRLYIDGREPPDYRITDTSILTVGADDSQLVINPDSSDTLTDFVRLAPVFEGDNVRALEVHPIEGSDIFDRLGLQPGDKITSIDGAQVTDAFSATAALRRLSEGEALQVTIMRQGQVEKVSLDGLLVYSARSKEPPE